jgi:hypothetical protein
MEFVIVREELVIIFIIGFNKSLEPRHITCLSQINHISFLIIKLKSMDYSMSFVLPSVEAAYHLVWFT